MKLEGHMVGVASEYWIVPAGLGVAGMAGKLVAVATREITQVTSVLYYASGGKGQAY